MKYVYLVLLFLIPELLILVKLDSSSYYNLILYMRRIKHHRDHNFKDQGKEHLSLRFYLT
jgi:hypothetical protein